jgi:hypothetical protein
MAVHHLWPRHVRVVHRVSVSAPDSALKAKWLTPHERNIADGRPQKRNHSFKSNEWRLPQAIEASEDPKTWLLFLYTAFTSIPNSEYTNVSFLTLILSQS